MTRMLKRWILLGMLAAQMLLSGCSMPKLTFNPQDLYCLPTLPARYTELNAHLNAVMESGAEYAAPSSGANIQPVQLVDLDGDGREEAVAFFRKADDEKPLKIYIFADNGDDYQQVELIEGSGTGIYSIAYNDLDNDGRRELVVGWKATADLQVLEVYSLLSRGAELLLRSDYVKYSISDLDQDQRQELVVFRADEEGGGIADYYTCQPDGTFASQSAARISVTMAELSQQGRVTAGTLQEGIPAIFVTGVMDMSRVITDILAVWDGELKNVVLSQVTGVSGEIAPYCALYPTDLNGDGMTDIPVPVQADEQGDETQMFRRIDWYNYTRDGASNIALRTYHNIEDGWYFCLPEEWLGGVLVSRLSTPDESLTTFFVLGGEEEMAEPFLRITAISGSNRELHVVRGERFVLSRQSERIYTAELLAANQEWKHGMTADEVRAAFSLIATEWATGDY